MDAGAQEKEAVGMIRIRNLSVSYFGENVLHIDALDFHDAAITTILGSNGAGKSTLLKAVDGILPCSGNIELFDGGAEKVQDADKAVCSDLPVQVSHMTPRQRARRIGLLPQNLSTPDMDVYTLVSHGRFSRLGFSKILGEKDRRAVENALEAAELTALSSRQVGELSGGERERAYLAMVIAQDPDYFLLDEPMGSLDIRHQVKLAEILRKLASQGKGIIMTSHDLPQSLSLSDFAVVLDGSRVAASGAPETLVGSPVFREVFGVSARKNESEEAFYRYQLWKQRQSGSGNPCEGSGGTCRS